MRRDIVVTRQAIVKVTQILAGMKVNVTQQGADAFVTWNAKGKPTRVNIPYLPDNSSDELIAAVQGFLDHEVAHILYTDPKARVDKSLVNWKRIDIMHNITEDCWIEPKMAKNYPGSRSNLSKTRLLVFRDRVSTKAQKWMDENEASRMPEPVAIKFLLVPLLRALAGQEELRELMDEKGYWSFFPTILPKLETFFAEEFSKCESSWDTLELAKKVYDAIATDDPDEDESDDSRDEGDPAGDEKSDEKKDKKSDDSKGGDGKKDDDKDEKSEDGEKDEPGGGEKDEPEEDDNLEDDDLEDDEGGSDGSDDGDDETEMEDDADGSDDTTDPSDAEGDAEEDGSTTGDASEMAEAIEDVGDFEHEAAEIISGEYKAAATDLNWIPFTADYDEYPIYQPRPDSDRYVGRMTETVRTLIGPMQKKLERMLLSRRRSHFEPGRRSGRINPSALHRIKAHDDRIFRRKIEKKDKDTCVHLVIDLSGSMGAGVGSRMGVAFQSAYALASTLERCRIPVMVSGFSTKSLPSKVLSEKRETERKLGIRYSIFGEANYQPIFKTWNENMNHKVTERFADGFVCDPVRHDSRNNYKNMDPVAVNKARALARAENVLPVVEKIRAGGASLHQVAAELNAGGIKTAERGN